MTMKRLIPFLFVLSAVGAGTAMAQAVDTGSGSAVVSAGSAAGSATPTPAITVVVPDPNVDPLGDASAAYKLYKSGAYIPAVIVLAFVLLTVLSTRIDALKTGRAAAYIAAGIGLLSALIPAAANGQTPTLSAWLAALGAAVALILHPTTAAPSPTGNA